MQQSFLTRGRQGATPRGPQCHGDTTRNSDLPEPEAKLSRIDDRGSSHPVESTSSGIHYKFTATRSRGVGRLYAYRCIYLVVLDLARYTVS